MPQSLCFYKKMTDHNYVIRQFFYLFTVYLKRIEEYPSFVRTNIFVLRFASFMLMSMVRKSKDAMSILHSLSCHIQRRCVIFVSACSVSFSIRAFSSAFSSVKALGTKIQCSFPLSVKTTMTCAFLSGSLSFKTSDADEYILSKTSLSKGSGVLTSNKVRIFMIFKS